MSESESWTGMSDDPPQWSTPDGEEPSDDSDWMSRLNTSVPHSARRYNYWLGGKDNFAADRESGAQIEALFPNIRIGVWENRQFLRRAVGLLTAQEGVRQFLDIGTGLPSADNTHEVAQRIAPQSRVVYVDNDPLVMTHARALLTSEPDIGPTDYIEADLREPEKILDQAARTLDFQQPVALMLVAILHFISDEEDPYAIVARLIAGLPSGSYLVVSHATGEFATKEAIEGAARGPAPVWLRSREQIAPFFEGLELLPPGIVSTVHWRPETDPPPRSPAEALANCGIARIP